RMFADAVIPIRMRDPRDVEFILETKRQFDVRPTRELVENDAVVNPLNTRLRSIAIIKQISAALFDFRYANRLNSQERLSRGEIDPGFLFLGFDLEQDDVLRFRIRENR